MEGDAHFWSSRFTASAPALRPSK